MKQNWNIYSWNRPTIQWSLECEAQGKTRAMGFDAVQTQLSQSSKVEKIRKLGIAFVVIFSVSMLCSCPAIAVPSLIPAHLGLTRLSFVVMGPWLCTVIYDVRNVNKSNIQK